MLGIGRMGKAEQTEAAMGTNSRIGQAIFVALSFLLASACLSSEGKGPERESLSLASICQVVRGNQSEIGKEHRFRAVYETDGGSYSYFHDKYPAAKNGCQKDATIDIDRLPNMREKSVVDFFSEAKYLCKKRGVAICMYSADVDFDAVVMERNGVIYLHLNKVHHYKIYF